MPPLHPMIVHFPIALFVVAVLFDGLTLFTRKNNLVTATRLLMVLSTVGTIAAIASGELLRSHRGSFLPHGLLMLHQLLGILFGIYAIFLCALRVRSKWRPTGSYLTLAALGVVLLAAVGHTGGKMAWPSLPAVHAPKSSVAVGGVAKSNQSNLSASGTARATGSRPGNTSGTKHQTMTGSSHGTEPSNPPSPPQASHPSTEHTSSTKSITPKPSTQSTQSGSSSSSSATGPVLLQYGDTSTVVITLQEALHAAGAFNHSYTTYFGSITEGAVKAFQAEHGIAVTGSVNQQTLNLLEQRTGVRIDASSLGSSGASGSSGQASGASGGSTGAGVTTSGAGSSGGSSSGQSSGQSSTPPASQPSTTSQQKSPAQPSVDQVRIQAGYNAFVNSCQACHSLATATQYLGVYSESDWSSVVSRMQSYAGGNIADTQDIIYYLSHSDGH